MEQERIDSMENLINSQAHTIAVLREQNAGLLERNEHLQNELDRLRRDRGRWIWIHV